MEKGRRKNEGKLGETIRGRGDWLTDFLFSSLSERSFFHTRQGKKFRQGDT